MVIICKLPWGEVHLITKWLWSFKDTFWAGTQGWDPTKKLNSCLWSSISICHVYKAFMIIDQKSTLRPLCIGSLYKTPMKVNFISYVQHRALALDPNPSMSRWRLVNLKKCTAWCIKESHTIYFKMFVNVR